MAGHVPVQQNCPTNFKNDSDRFIAGLLGFQVSLGSMRLCSFRLVCFQEFRYQVCLEFRIWGVRLLWV